jgi:hypothetical protein
MVMKLNLTNDNFIFGIISNIITSLLYIMKAESRKQKAESRKQKAESRKPLSNYNTKQYLCQEFGEFFCEKISIANIKSNLWLFIHKKNNLL